MSESDTPVSSAGSLSLASHLAAGVTNQLTASSLLLCVSAARDKGGEGQRCREGEQAEQQTEHRTRTTQRGERLSAV